jgi:hypothetical protein
MVRTFARGGDQIRLEQRYDTQTAEFLLVIEHHDRYQETKRFAEALTFREFLSAFEEQLATEHWLPLGPIEHRFSATTTRRYTSVSRTFELLLFQRTRQGEAVWTVERVLDVSWACKVAVIPGMQAVTASTPDVAFARACDCIDKWLWMSRR